jgi:hypothetical protein
LQRHQRALFAQNAFNLVAGADRNSGFGNHHHRRRKKGGDVAHRFINERQVSMTIAAPRRSSYRYKDAIDRPNRRCE